MKRFWIFSAIIIALYSCTESTELDTPEAEEEQLELDGGYAITATISMSQSDDESETRISSDTISGDATEWVFTWDASDADGNVYLMSEVSGSSYESSPMTSTDVADEAPTATFTGTLNTESTAYSILYTSGSAIWGSDNSSSTPCYSDNSSSDAIIIDLSQGQTGKEVDLIDNLVMISDLTKENLSDGSSISPTLYHVGSFMILEISFANVPEYLRDVTVESISYSGVNTKCEIHPTTYAYDETGFYDYTNYDEQPAIEITPKETITVDDATTAKFYLNILPTTMEDTNEITTTLHFSNGTEYEIKKTFTSESKNCTITLDRAQFNTTEIVCDLYYETSQSIYDYLRITTSEESITTLSEDDNDMEITTTKEMRYKFGNYTFNIDALTGTYIYESTDATTETDIKISDRDHMYALAAFTNAGRTSGGEYTFTLTTDIDLNEGKDIDKYDLWTPIGYCSPYSGYKIKVPFEGTFDGAGHTISNYYAHATSKETVFVSLGLFGYIEAAYDTTYDTDGNIVSSIFENYTTIKNLIIDSSTCIMNRPGSHAGILTGTLECGATIINCGCESTCSITMNNRGAVGGLVGSVDHDSHDEIVYIYNSYNQGSVTATDTDNTESGTINIGGLCGRTLSVDNINTDTVIKGSTIIKSCYSTGKISVEEKQDYISACRMGYLVGFGYSEDKYINLFLEKDNAEFKGSLETEYSATSTDNEVTTTTYYYYAVGNDNITDNIPYSADYGDSKTFSQVMISEKCYYVSSLTKDGMLGNSNISSLPSYNSSTYGGETANRTSTNILDALNNTAADLNDDLNGGTDTSDDYSPLSVSTWTQTSGSYPRLTFTYL